VLADKRLCHPLTVRDFASRYIICRDALATAKQEYAFQNVGIREVAESIGLARLMQYDLACLIARSGTGARRSIWMGQRRGRLRCVFSSSDRT